MLTIWLDSGAKSSFGSGIWRYVSELDQELSRLDQTSVLKIDPKNVLDSWPSLAAKASIKVGWPYFLASYLSRSKDKPDIFHGLANLNVPYPLKRKKEKSRFVVTIHDVIPLLPGSGCSLSYKMQFRYLLPKVLAFCDQIVCPSKWTLNHIVQRYPFVAEKIIHIPNGFHPMWRKAFSSQARKKDKLTIDLLAVSRYEPYKKLDLLIDILKALPSNYVLTVVTDSNGLVFLQKKAKKEGVSTRLSLHSQITDEKLCNLYDSADLFLHPSLYEGFGLPPLEAATLGVPVIYTKGNALEEYLPQEIAWGLDAKASLSDWVFLVKKMAINQDQITPESSWAFTWQNTAFRLKDLYNSLI